MFSKFDQGCMATFLVILVFIEFKIHGLIKIHPLYYYNFTMNVQLRIGLVVGQRPYT